MSLISNSSPRLNRPRSTRPRSSGAKSDGPTVANVSLEPSFKRRKYFPGGPGGGGRYFNEDGTEVSVGGSSTTGYNYISSRRCVSRQDTAKGVTSDPYNRSDRCTRTRSNISRSQSSSMRYASAAQAAAVVQSDGYKPREERAWEEFHPNLDIDFPLRAFDASEVEGQLEPCSVALRTPSYSSEGYVPGSSPIDKRFVSLPFGTIDISTLRIPGTPGGGKRRPGRPPKDPIAFFAAKAAKLGKGFYHNALKTPNNPPPIPASKEKLTLPQPSYRKSNTLAHFEDKALGFARLVDKSMTSVGYQESNIFIRPPQTLIKVSDTSLEEDIDSGLDSKNDCKSAMTIECGRVEYDMDEQDDKWLDSYNAQRQAAGLGIIQREIFEIVITKIEKEWYNLEKRIPKPNPKPPQTHRPRSSSATAVNGEAQSGEEQDSKCAICDDGDCENTNAIVFCDGCDLAVHQECYGVPFIPEGQWLCRKCQLIGRGIPTCIFCPNTDGAFKQTNASKWAHLLCAMWIPEVSLGNHTFMEPVMEVEKVPKTRWKLSCYLCNQRMGACIQCGNKSCYQAFHVTCARRARLYLRMKNSHGTLSVLDGTTNMKAFCDKHCPLEWLKENDVAGATRDARNYFKKTMRGRLWAESQASALEMATTYCHLTCENNPEEPQATGIKMELTLGHDKKTGNRAQKPVWKLPSGAPVIPFCVYERVEKSLGRFNIQKCKEYTADICRYWTLKREARRGAALLKRLQLQLETFSSIEITRRNFADMGSAGKPRLQRRIDFAKIIMKDIENLKLLSEEIVKREAKKLEAARFQVEFVDTVYFPIAMLFPPIIDGALALDTKALFKSEITELQRKVGLRHYTSVIPFTQQLCRIFQERINLESQPQIINTNQSPAEKSMDNIKECRKLIKRIINKVVQPQLESAARAESEISGRPVDELLRELFSLLGSIWHTRPESIANESNVVTKEGTDLEMSDTVSGIYNIQSLDSKEKNIESDSLETKSYSVVMSDIRDEKGNNVAMTKLSHQLEEDTVMTELDAKTNDPYANPHNKFRSTPDTGTTSDNNSYILPRKDSHLAPPTPPISNDENGSVTQDDVMSSGGIPWIFNQFEVKGTTGLLDTESSCLISKLNGLNDRATSSKQYLIENLEAQVAATTMIEKSRKIKYKRGHG